MSAFDDLLHESLDHIRDTADALIDHDVKGVDAGEDAEIAYRIFEHDRERFRASNTP